MTKKASKWRAAMLAIMKTRLALTAPILAAAVLTGCAASEGGQATPTPTPTPSVSVEEQFLTEMRATDAFFGFPDSQLIQIGHSVCEAIEDGSTFDDMVRTLAITDYSEDEASAIIFASARAYCPEQEK